MVLYGKRCEEEKADVFPIQRVGGCCEPMKNRSVNSPWSGCPQRYEVFSRADGVRPLLRKVMIVTVSGRL